MLGTIHINSNNVQWSIHLHQFALICIYAACKMHKYKQINIVKHIYYGLYICLQGSIYAYMPCIYAYIAIYTFVLSPRYIYIYIYMQRETQKYHAQATSAAGSCSQYGITIHQSSPEATIGFYQETSQ